MAIMYVLGSFLFSSDSLVPKAVDRNTSFSWAEQVRLNKAPALQAIGLGEDTLSINGTAYSCVSQGKSPKEQVAELREVASAMTPLVLLDGSGYYYGRWVVKNIQEKRMNLWQNSTPRKIEFSLQLAYYVEDSV